MQLVEKLKRGNGNVKGENVRNENARSVKGKKRLNGNARNESSEKGKGNVNVKGRGKERGRKESEGKWSAGRWNANDSYNNRDSTTAPKQSETDHRFEMARTTFG